MTGPSEAGLETAICESLVDSGAYLGPAKNGTIGGGVPEFDPSLGIDTAELFAFIGATQGEEWEKVRKSHSTPTEAQPAFLSRLVHELLAGFGLLLSWDLRGLLAQLTGEAVSVADLRSEAAVVLGIG